MDDTDATVPVPDVPAAATRDSAIDDQQCGPVTSVLQKSWEDLYKAEMPRLVRYLVKCFGDSDMRDAADAAHNAFVELFTKWDTVRSPSAWLRTVAFRQMLRQHASAEYPLDVLRREPDTVPASARLELGEETQAVLGGLRQLPLAQRQVLALIYDHFSYSEIAQIMSISQAAVRKNAERARRRMSEQTLARDHASRVARRGRCWNIGPTRTLASARDLVRKTKAMLNENQMIHLGKPGDDGDAALGAALAAADEDMLSAISNGLDLDMGLARMLEDLGGSSAARRASRHRHRRIPGKTGEDRTPPFPGLRLLRIHPRGADAASPIRVAALIRDVNASDEAVGDQFLRVRQAAGIAARSVRAAEQAAAGAQTAEIAHRAVQAEQPRRRAPLPRQVTFALGTAVLDGLACYLAAQALGGSLDATLVWTGLFLGVLAGGEAALGFCRDRGERAWRVLVMLIGFVVILLGTLRVWFLGTAGTGGLMPAIAGACLFTVTTAGFLTVGYRALRVTETPSAWRARQQEGKARHAARIARAEADRTAAERDRLIDAYLGHLRRLALKTCPAERQLAVESVVRQHLLGELQLGEKRPGADPARFDQN